MTTDRSRSKDQEGETLQRRSVGNETARDDRAIHPLLRLQRQVGNRQVARMLAEQQATFVQREVEEEEEELLQTMRDPSLQRTSEDEVLQLERDRPEVGLEGGPISDGLTKRIAAKRGGGSPLPDSTRTQMESGFGTSFDHVRLHTDAESASISRSLGAKAATTGSDIFFGQGASVGDKGLLAHELTHVVQQSTMRSSGPMTVNKEGDSHEVEANRMASAITSGTTQRMPDEEFEK